MKKTFYFGALIGAMVLSVSLSSCVKDEESASVTAVRGAKATLLQAQAEAEKLNAEAAKLQAEGQAALLAAQAEYYKAQAAYQQAQADRVAAQTEIDKANAEVELEKAKVALEEAKARLESQVAYYKSQIAWYELQIAQYANEMAQAGLDMTAKVKSAYDLYASALSSLTSLRKDVVDYQASVVSLEADQTNWEAYKAQVVKNAEERVALAEKEVATVEKKIALYEKYAPADMATWKEQYEAAAEALEVANSVVDETRALYVEAVQVENNARNAFAETELVKQFNDYSSQVYSFLETEYVEFKVSDDYIYGYNTYVVKYEDGFTQMKRKFTLNEKTQEARLGTAKDAQDSVWVDPSTGEKNILNERTYYAQKNKVDSLYKDAQDSLKRVDEKKNPQEYTAQQAKVVYWQKQAVAANEAVEGQKELIAEVKEENAKVIAFVEAVKNTKSDLQTEYAAVVEAWKTAYTAYAEKQTAYNDANDARDAAQVEANVLATLLNNYYFYFDVNGYSVYVDAFNYDSVMADLNDELKNAKSNVAYAKEAVSTAKASITSDETAVAHAKNQLADAEAKVAAYEKYVEVLKKVLDDLLAE